MIIATQTENCFHALLQIWRRAENAEMNGLDQNNMDANYYDVDKCRDELEDFITTLGTMYSYDTILCAMERIIDNT